MRLAIVFLSGAMPVMAQDFSLVQPIDCELGDTCYIQQFVDHDDTDGVQNFQCGTLTYDGHNGTDFALLTLTALEEGVDVLATAEGRVLRTRDDMPDILYTLDMGDDIIGRECGNGLVLEHPDGWTTQYCHLKLGSIVVQPGESVAAGHPLGQVGLSGKSMFPHLHITVRHNGEVIDPFDTDGIISCSQPDTNTLWNENIPTPQGGLLSTGFSAAVPSFEDVKAGTAHVDQLRSDAPIVIWAYMFGSQPGDRVSLTIDGPNGPLFQSEDVLDRGQALVFRAGGLNAPPDGWPSGVYNGDAALIRNGTVLGTQTLTIAIP